MKFIHPSKKSVILCNNLKGVQLLTSLKLRLSHPQQHTFKHNFHNILNTIYICIKDFETLCICLLHCSIYTNEREALLNIIQGIDNSILEFGDSHIVKDLLHGQKVLRSWSNTNILNTNIDLLLKTKRFWDFLK